MIAKVEGVLITLTPEQIEQINDAKKQRIDCANSFEKMLKLFGFKKASDINVITKQRFYYFTEASNGWYAEIIDFGNFSECWMTGKGLKSGGFPGGYHYSTPEEVAEEILRSGL